MQQEVIAPVWRLLYDTRFEPQRPGHGEAAESDVDEENAFRQFDARDAMAACGGDIGHRLPAHPAYEIGDVATERLEDRGEKHVQLETINAALLAPMLLLDGGEIERGNPARKHLDIFNRDRSRMGKLQQNGRAWWSE